MMNGYDGFSGYGPGYESYGMGGGVPYGHGYMSADVASVIMPMLFFMLLIGLAMVIFQIWLYFRIFAKAGYNGWWGLLSLVPGIGPLVVLLVLAFDNWPIHRTGSTSPFAGATQTGAPYAPAAPAAPIAPYAPAPAPAAPAPAPAPAAPAAPAEPPVPAPPAEAPAPQPTDET